MGNKCYSKCFKSKPKSGTECKSKLTRNNLDSTQKSSENMKDINDLDKSIEK
jgi:hypothetical protein